MILVEPSCGLGNVQYIYDLNLIDMKCLYMGGKNIKKLFLTFKSCHVSNNINYQ